MWRLLSTLVTTAHAFALSAQRNNKPIYQSIKGHIRPVIRTHNSHLCCQSLTTRQHETNNNTTKRQDVNFNRTKNIRDLLQHEPSSVVSSETQEISHHMKNTNMDTNESSGMECSCHRYRVDDKKTAAPLHYSVALLKKRRKMKLSLYGHEGAGSQPMLREKVVGEHNHIEFDHPSTGQVTYHWEEDSGNTQSDDIAKDDDSVVNQTTMTYFTPSVLILVKQDDDELLKIAANAVSDLTEKSEEVNVMLLPDIAAELKHCFGVNVKDIHIFDHEPVSTGSDFKNQDHIDNQYETRPDLICTLGGDGLLMYASMLFPGPCPPILCIAGGSLGFLTSFKREEMVDAIKKSLGLIPVKEDTLAYDDVHKQKSSQLTRNNFGVRHSLLQAYNHICLNMRMRLCASVINKEGIVCARFNVLNEVVIDRANSPYLATLECFCDDIHLTTVQADGIIFSTPTGSTAYSMSAGGSVVHPVVPAILVTAVCPHALSFRPMIFPDHVVLWCYVPEDARANAAVAFDGKNRRELCRGESVQIQMSPYPVPTINRDNHSKDWLTSLKRNFNFNNRPRQHPL